MFARIEPSTLEVIELWDVAELPPLYPDLDALYWPCGPAVKMGWKFDIPTGTFSAPPVIPVALAATQESACRAIDAAAGNTRLQYITDVPGQSETYLEKGQDAVNYKAAGYPAANIASYGWVAGYARSVYGATPTAAQYQAAADTIITLRGQWVVVGQMIEEARSAGKEAVMACTAANPAAMTPAEVATLTAARDAAIAALQAL